MFKNGLLLIICGIAGPAYLFAQSPSSSTVLMRPAPTGLVFEYQCSNNTKTTFTMAGVSKRHRLIETVEDGKLVHKKIPYEVYKRIRDLGTETTEKYLYQQVTSTSLMRETEDEKVTGILDDRFSDLVRLKPGLKIKGAYREAVYNKKAKSRTVKIDDIEVLVEGIETVNYKNQEIKAFKVVEKRTSRSRPKTSRTTTFYFAPSLNGVYSYVVTLGERGVFSCTLIDVRAPAPKN